MSSTDPLTEARDALRMIATRPAVERNPDGVDQAAYTFQAIARSALVGLSRWPAPVRTHLYVNDADPHQRECWCYPIAEAAS